MPAIPLPFVVALLLAILLVRMSSRMKDEAVDRPAIIFVGMCMVMVTTVGLRWSLDLAVVRFIQPIVAALLPSTAWICFAGLAQRKPLGWWRLWPHVVPVVLVILLSATWRLWHLPIDVVLSTIFFGYGIALLRLASGGPDALGAARLSDVRNAHLAVKLAGLMLIGSAFVDLLVAIDFDVNQGIHAASIVAIANLLMLAIIAYLVAVIGRSRPALDIDATAPVQQVQIAPSDREIGAAIDRLMREKSLFRDPDLTLNRLARRAGLPARQISAAINRLHGRNVSQIVNEYRIVEAKRRLEGTDDSITTIMFECGFQTKSNFNREFRRVTGMSPSDYRRSGATTKPVTSVAAPSSEMR
nr:AraC family transcriptional regulator [uncultured Dongia sp.]